jgi:hypothetical protein
MPASHRNDVPLTRAPRGDAGAGPVILQPLSEDFLYRPPGASWRGLARSLPAQAERGR